MKRFSISRAGSLSDVIGGLMTCSWTVFLAASVQGQTGTFIDRQFSTDLRMVTYNILWDSIFPDRDASKAAKFSRVVNALNPDILNLQEIGLTFEQNWTPKTAADVRNLLNDIAPLSGGSSWNVFQGGDNVIASKYPLTLTRRNTSPQGERSQAIALVDLPDDIYPTDFYVMNNHFKCCGNSGGFEDFLRQQQADAIVNWLRDARTLGENITLPPGTPFAVVGDFNMVGGLQPLNTLLNGNIIDEGIYGSDSPPDWDGTNLVDARPVHNGVGSNFYTWRNDGSNFDPGQLDFILYSDSNLDTGQKFVLNTVSMSSAQRSAAGLWQYDTAQGNSSSNFDHLPVVVDFRIFDFLQSDFNYDRLVDATDLAAWQGNYGTASGATRAMGDANGDGRVDGRDFLVWQRQFGGVFPALASVPEPNSLTLLVVTLAGIYLRRPHSQG